MFIGRSASSGGDGGALKLAPCHLLTDGLPSLEVESSVASHALSSLEVENSVASHALSIEQVVVFTLSC